jgi:hypothetical protein
VLGVDCVDVLMTVLMCWWLIVLMCWCVDDCVDDCGDDCVDDCVDV